MVETKDPKNVAKSLTSKGPVGSTNRALTLVKPKVDKSAATKVPNRAAEVNYHVLVRGSNKNNTHKDNSRECCCGLRRIGPWPN